MVQDSNNPPDDEYEVVVVINNDLKMKKGKILSQFGHAIDQVLVLRDPPRRTPRSQAQAT